MPRPILVSVTAAVVAAVFARGAAQAQPTVPRHRRHQGSLSQAAGGSALGHACIGIVADPCTDAAGGDTAKRQACADRERAVWQAGTGGRAARRVPQGRLQGYHRVAVTQAQKSWESSLRTLCPIFGRIEPTARCAG